ncbi:MAG: hypothetical protein ACRD8O_13705 [Bryobacteraceae bacterium]
MIATLAAAVLLVQAAQNPSPMVEHTRAHGRVTQQEVSGERVNLTLGTLLRSPSRKTAPLVVHFNGARWLAEVSARRWRRDCAVLAVHLGAGSSVYSRAFTDPARFAQLIEEAGGARYRPIVLTAFSAGYGAIREILRNRDNWRLIDAVVLADGLHVSYVPEGKPGPIDAPGLEPFIAWAGEAAAGRKRFVMTHSEIFPGTFASTTETADALLDAVGLRRRPVLKWGPLGMQHTSSAERGRLLVLGFAGNAAPDHVDHFHALERWLRLAAR